MITSVLDTASTFHILKVLRGTLSARSFGKHSNIVERDLLLGQRPREKAKSMRQTELDCGGGVGGGR